MAGGVLSVYRIRLAVLFLLWIGLACFQMVFMAQAQPVSAHVSSHALPIRGVSGTCKWQYTWEDEDRVTLHVSTIGETGVLERWTDAPPWRAEGLRKYFENTRNVVILGEVKAATCRGMFKGFKRVESIDLDDLDTKDVTDMVGMFEGCSALKELSVRRQDTTKAVDMSRAFFQCSSLVSLDMSGWQTPSVTNMTDMFSGLTSLNRLVVGRNFHFGRTFAVDDTDFCAGTHWVQVGDGTYDNPKGQAFASFSDLTAFHNKFNDQGYERYVLQARTRGTCGSCTWEYVTRPQRGAGKDANSKATYTLRIFPSNGEEVGTLDNWESQKRTEEDAASSDATPPWGRPFCSDYYLHTVDVVIPAGKNGVPPKPVVARTGKGMFKNFTSLHSLDIAGLDMTDVTSLSHMFAGCSVLESIDASEWNVGAVEDMSALFQDCYCLATVGDLSAWDTSSVKSMRYMFKGCRKLTSLEAGGWNTHAVTDMTYMFWQTFRLCDIYLGADFSIKDLSCFHEAGLLLASHWMLVQSDDDDDELKGTVFSTTRAFVEFQNAAKNTPSSGSVRRYKRVTPVLMVTFDKGARDVEGIMDPLYIVYGTGMMIPKTMYRRRGYVFSGWKDSDGMVYEDQETLENDLLEYRSYKVLTAVWKPDVPPGTQAGSTQACGTQAGSSFKVSQKFVEGPIVFDAVREVSGRAPYVDPLSGHATKHRPMRQQKEGWCVEDGKVCYRQANGSKLSGWHQITGTAHSPRLLRRNWFYFDENGHMLRGRHYLASRSPNAQGVREKHWFCLDKATGALCHGWQDSVEDGVRVWRYYRASDGRMLTGKRRLVSIPSGKVSTQEKYWFYLDKETGIPRRGWHFAIENGEKKWYYSKEDGTMLVGSHDLVDASTGTRNRFYFDEITGERVHGWKYVKEKNEWYYYGDDGAMLTGQQKLGGGDGKAEKWFYLDEETGARVHGWKYISYQDKLCYYGPDGVMLKGQQVIDDKVYCFDEVTGALKDCWS